MKFREIFRFEFAYQSRRVRTRGYFGDGSAYPIVPWYAAGDF